MADSVQTAKSYNQAQRQHFIFYLSTLLLFLDFRTFPLNTIKAFDQFTCCYKCHFTHLLSVLLGSWCHFVSLLIHLGSLNGIKRINSTQYLLLKQQCVESKMQRWFVFPFSFRTVYWWISFYSTPTEPFSLFSFSCESTF